jgi:hypothetical protein
MFASNTTAAVLRGMLVTVLLAWSAYWLVSGYHYMHEHSIVMKQGFGSDGIQMWEIFNLKMAAAHHFLRWLPGAVLLVAMMLLTRGRRRRVAGLVRLRSAD